MGFCSNSIWLFHPAKVRGERRCRYKCVLDLPLPRLLDTRPWRCLDCGQNFAVQPADVRAAFPTALRHNAAKQKTLWFSGSFLVHLAQKFSEVLNAGAVKRFILDMYAANSLSLAHAEVRLAVLACIPRVSALRSVLRTALASYLPRLVAEIQRSAHVYSGSAIKGDGNYKVPQRIKGGGTCCFHRRASKVSEAKKFFVSVRLHRQNSPTY